MLDGILMNSRESLYIDGTWVGTVPQGLMTSCPRVLVSSCAAGADLASSAGEALSHLTAGPPVLTAGACTGGCAPVRPPAFAALSVSQASCF